MSLNLEWVGTNAYFSGHSATLALLTGPNYTWENVPSAKNRRDPTTGPHGEYIKGDKDWYEYIGGNRYNRLLDFEFDLLNDAGGGGDPVLEDARENGWSLSEVRARDNDDENDGNDIEWYSPRRLAGVSVPSSDYLFSCERMKINFRSNYGTGRVEGTFEAHDIVLGGYLDRSYDQNTMRRYNPCAEFNGEECFLDDDRIMCGDEEYNPGPNPPEPSSHLDWYAEYSFLEVDHAVAVARDVRRGSESDYTFQDYDNRRPVYGSGSSRGNVIVRDTNWDEEEEDGDRPVLLVNRGLAFEFDRLRDGSGYQIFRVQLRDSSRNNNWVAWQDYSSQLVVPTNRGFDYFQCDRIEFDFPGGSEFDGSNVEIGGYLDRSYDKSQLNAYNPCVYFGYPGTCRAVNGQIFCGGAALPRTARSQANAAIHPEGTFVQIKGHSTEGGGGGKGMLCMKIRGGKIRVRNKIVLDECDTNDEAQMFALEPVPPPAADGADDVGLAWFEIRPKLAAEKFAVGTNEANHRAWLSLEYPEDKAERRETQIFTTGLPPSGPDDGGTGEGGEEGHTLQLGSHPGCHVSKDCLYVTNQGTEINDGDPVMVRTEEEMENFAKHGDIIEKWIFTPLGV